MDFLETQAFGPAPQSFAVARGDYPFILEIRKFARPCSGIFYD
jgi:hypothetical protein